VASFEANVRSAKGAAWPLTKRALASAMAQVSTAGGCNATVAESRDTVTGWGAMQPCGSAIGGASSKATPSARSLCRHDASSDGKEVVPGASPAACFCGRG
jgi:hypothetical protein